jgi:hypothetical protein
MNSEWRPHTHPYIGDGIEDHRGEDRCTDCGFPRRHKLHTLPKTADAVTKQEARRLGERDTT